MTRVREFGVTVVGVLLAGSLAAIAANAAAANHTQPLYLDQGWNDTERNQFYFTPQGSYLIPYAWFLALEQAQNSKPFNDAKHIARIGYLVDDQAYTASNPDGLPIGFAKEPVSNGDAWLGYTCAACHTGEVRFRGKNIRVDGAPTLADFTLFNQRLIEALQATLNQPRKFERFAQQVLSTPDATSKAALRAQVAAQLDVMQQIYQRSTPTVPYGNGRVDAFGIIMNEVFARDLHQPLNVKVPTAQVSYPFLWGTPQLDFVQWNGSANNPFGRNVGEVLGTFGQATLTGPIAQLGTNTARARELFMLENLVAKLAPPQWPEALLGKIDSEKAARGRALYSAYRNGEPSCESCHSLRDASGQYPLTPAAENLFGVQFVETQMIGLADIGTDPLMALNFATRNAFTGDLAPLLPAPFTGASVLPAPVLLSITVGMAANYSIATAQPPFAAAEKAALIGYRIKAPGLPPYVPKNLAAYKARPISGIWATAPYLHNGSVPNLYQLLLPPAQRMTLFGVGSHDFDADAVGYVSEDEDATFLFDTGLPGNSNAGHDYGTDLTADQRWDLIEFLKTL
ncbi:MAG: cytochrome C [Gammaproteobacteria bacterium]|nr:cytochrome C [Gammaproteobacteria bacterium]